MKAETKLFKLSSSGTHTHTNTYIYIVFDMYSSYKERIGVPIYVKLVKIFI